MGLDHGVPKVIYDREFSSYSEIRPEMLDWNAILDGKNRFHWSAITPAVSESADHSCLERRTMA